MPALRLLARLVLYYAVVLSVFATILWLAPGWREYLPVGRVPTLVAQAAGVLEKGKASLQVAHSDSLVGSVVWMVSAIGAALLTSLPVSWVYMDIRNPEDYDQSLVDTVVILPVIVTSIVVVVQNSLALSFSLAGIAGAARFRNSLKSSGDLLFILLAIGIGLSCGIGAMELAVVTSIAFNLCFVALWLTRYGGRRGRKHYMNEFAVAEGEMAADIMMTAVSATVVTAETVKSHRHKDDDDDD